MNHPKRERLVQRANRGMTLTELMIVVAIIGIIAAFAYPSYRDSVRKSNRAEGKTLLMDAAARQERFFSNFNAYTSVIVAPGGCTGTACGLGYTANTSENGLYQLSIPAANATSYTLQVTAAGGQTDDAQCATMSINSQGQKTATSADCW